MNSEYNYNIDDLKNFKNIREKSHYFQIYNNLNFYFIWKSEKIKIPRNLEIILRQNGLLAFLKKEEKFVHASIIDYDEYNEPININCIGLGTHPVSYGTVPVQDVILLFNNPLGISDEMEIRFFTFEKAQNDISRMYQLINSRLIPLLEADSDKAAGEIVKAFDNLKAGKPALITTSIFEEVKKLDILDPNMISKMEYLTSYDEVLDKNIINRFGGSMDIKDKKAQVNNLELKAYDDLTTSNYLSNYLCRQRFVDEMNEAGYDIELLTSPIFFDEASEEDIERESLVVERESLDIERESLDNDEKGGDNNEEV